MASASRFQLAMSSFSRRRPARGEAVKLGAPVVVGYAPLGVEQPLLLESEERRVERALLDEQGAARHLLNAEQHAVPVQRPQRGGLQDEDVERSGQQVRARRHGGILLSTLGETIR